MTVNLWIILAGAVLTYATRAGGHLILSRFERVHPRVEAGLNAVPAAVLTTLVAPSLVTGGLPEIGALAAGALAALRWGVMGSFFLGGLVLVVLRQLIG
jgi:uncharacterized membrane protein